MPRPDTGATTAIRSMIQCVRLRNRSSLDRFTVVHRTITIGDTLDIRGAIEYEAGFDSAFQHGDRRLRRHSDQRSGPAVRALVRSITPDPFAITRVTATSLRTRCARSGIRVRGKSATPRRIASSRFTGSVRRLKASGPSGWTAGRIARERQRARRGRARPHARLDGLRHSGP